MKRLLLLLAVVTALFTVFVLPGIGQGIADRNRDKGGVIEDLRVPGRIRPVGRPCDLYAELRPIDGRHATILGKVSAVIRTY